MGFAPVAHLLRDCQADRGSMAPLGAKCWFRLSMCQIVSVSRRGRSICASLTQRLDRDGVPVVHEARPVHRLDRRANWLTVPLELSTQAAKPVGVRRRRTSTVAPCHPGGASSWHSLPSAGRVAGKVDNELTRMSSQQATRSLQQRSSGPPPDARLPVPRIPSALAVALLAALLAAWTVAGAGAAPRRLNPGTWCGGTLWRLMTLSDALRKRVELQGYPSTIAQIAKVPPPKRIVPARTTGFQRQAWLLRAVIDRYRIASNGEIVLILYSIESAQYMNAYLANPHCLGPRARDRTGMIAARREFTSHCPTATPAWQLLGATVELAGVGFWNPRAVTRGALPTGAELRPLTNFKIVSGCGVG